MSNKVSLRWMTTDDIPRVVEIDSHYPHPWGRLSFQKAIQPPYKLMGVAEWDNLVVGYVGFVMNNPAKQPDGGTKNNVDIIKMAVNPTYLRQGLGRRMLATVQKFATKYSQGTHGDLHLSATVPETNLSMQLFLKASGFKAVRVERARWGDESGYVMVRASKWSAPAGRTASDRSCHGHFVLGSFLPA